MNFLVELINFDFLGERVVVECVCVMLVRVFGFGVVWFFVLDLEMFRFRGLIVFCLIMANLFFDLVVFVKEIVI